MEPCSATSIRVKTLGKQFCLATRARTDRHLTAFKSTHASEGGRTGRGVPLNVGVSPVGAGTTKYGEGAHTISNEMTNLQGLRETNKDRKSVV